MMAMVCIHDFALAKVMGAWCFSHNVIASNTYCLDKQTSTKH
jgi:hypothetical protein